MDRTDASQTPLTIKQTTTHADQSVPPPPALAMEHVRTSSSFAEHKAVNITALLTRSTTGLVGHSAFIRVSSATEAVLMAGFPVVIGVRKTAMSIITETVALNVSASTSSVEASVPRIETIPAVRKDATRTPHITTTTTNHVAKNV